MNQTDNEPYWSIDIPGLDEARAEMLLVKVNEFGPPLPGVTVDPNMFYTRHLDSASVEFLRKVVADGLASDSIGTEERSIGLSLLEDLDNWIAGTKTD